ncbi:MAG: DUF1272 domain-containing protein [Candidatus Accumulibacter delftensis]|jgi:hypothetical protein
MLELRPNCECCNGELPPQSREAMICSFECTFCADCVERRLLGRCPNCGGELVRRPIRPAELIRPRLKPLRAIQPRRRLWQRTPQLRSVKNSSE